ncbi:MAG: 50S ribosomal protein L1 [Desulfohalobiaceae bacterium]|nr:50S ribosomal protein L1 [Desulfohalobiaceae bacterium]
MAKISKNLLAAKQKLDKTKRYPLEDGISLALDTAFASFDETVDIAIRLGVNPKYPDQMVRGSVTLPNGLGKEVRVAAFCKGEKEEEARNAGADVVGADDLIQSIQQGWLEFDKAVATPDMMAQVGKIGKILGPRGMMPNAKTGTVTFELGKTIEELKAGKVEFRVDKGGVVHAPIGKVSFGTSKLLDNSKMILDGLYKAKPSGAKGAYFRSLSVSTTMGPGVKIDIKNASAFIEA